MLEVWFFMHEIQIFMQEIRIEPLPHNIKNSQENRYLYSFMKRIGVRSHKWIFGWKTSSMKLHLEFYLLFQWSIFYQLIFCIYRRITDPRSLRFYPRRKSSRNHFVPGYSIVVIYEHYFNRFYYYYISLFNQNNYFITNRATMRIG